MLLNDSQSGSDFTSGSLSIGQLSTEPYDPLKVTSYGNLSHPQTIAFVDSGVEDVAAVLNGLNADIKVVLDPAQNGIGQITQILNSYKNLTGVEIISHGNTAAVELGNSSLNSNSLTQYSQELQQWRTSLAPGADVLFYGCNVAAGEAGKTFVQDLSRITGADISASTDVTGSSAKGGNWALEYSTGNIETTNPLSASFMATYQGILPSLFTTQTPVNGNVNDGVGSAGDYELGMEFTSAKAGQISAIRYYKAPSETGSHVGNIWSSTGTLLASVTFSSESGSGWQQQALSSPLTIQANTTYVVSVNANTYFAATFGGLSATVTNGDLSAVADGSNGVAINNVPGSVPNTVPWEQQLFPRCCVQPHDEFEQPHWERCLEWNHDAEPDADGECDRHRWSIGCNNKLSVAAVFEQRLVKCEWSHRSDAVTGQQFCGPAGASERALHRYIGRSGEHSKSSKQCNYCCCWFIKRVYIHHSNPSLYERE